MGSIFEGEVAAEILKSQINSGRRKELYYFRDQQGLEVDFIVPQPQARFWMVEAKASKTVGPSMATSMNSLARVTGKRALRSIVVHRRARSGREFSALAENVEAQTLENFVAELNRK